MKKKNKIFHFLAFVAFSSAFLFALYFLIGRSVLKFSRKAEAEFRTRQAKLQEAQELVRSQPNPSRAEQELDRRAAELREISYNKRQLPKMIQVMARAALDGGLEVISIRPREDVKSAGPVPPGMNKVFIELVLYCEYRNLARYLESLSSLQYAFSVESLSVVRRAKSGESGINTRPLEASLLTSTYLVWEQQ